MGFDHSLLRSYRLDAGDAFRYFWLMFRAKAFEEQSQVEGQRSQVAFVDSLLAESASYAKALGERLKDKVFDEVFPQFAEGFVKSWGKPAAQLTDEELDTIFRATLTFLYRMLFLLYAEARDLLPVKEARGYFEISLTRMKKEIAEKSGEIDDEVYEKIKKAYSASETGLYDRLGELFAVIDKGRGELNVPVYNGGLFITFSGNQPKAEDEADEIRVAQFLSSHKIPDRYLAFGLDLLARNIDDKTHALVMIDYKSLGVRQLGSIYEGLLEFKVRVAREKMAVVAGKKGDAIVPYAEAEKLGAKIRMVGRGSAREEFIYKKGEVYLDNDRHERKASGSYYTVDYVVKYNVQNTVGPVLEARFEALRPKLREAERAYHEARKRQEGFVKMGQKGDDPEKTAYTYRTLVTDLFDLRVLDPAMGSGHFLVETVDFITRRLLDFLNAFPWNPVRAALRQTRENILEEMQKQGVSIDPARLTDINLLKRFVLKRCIYGVDLNPMAVELAKVSLWLDCFTLGAPLSFLDHHLRCGNSLIGTNVKTVEAIRLTKTGQHTLFAGPFAGLLDLTSLMVEVVERSDATVSDVHSSAEQFGQFRKSLEPYKEVLDLWTSQYFDNPRANEFVTLFGDQVMPALKGEMKVAKEFKEAIANARVCAKEKRFFHWDLEFPEIFVDLYKRDWKQNPGFDAVIGNPPYRKADEDADWKELRYQIMATERFETLFQKWDLYIPFIELSSQLCHSASRFSMIVENSLEQAPYASKCREFLFTKNTLNEIHSFPGLFLFDEAGVQNTIFICTKNVPEIPYSPKRFLHKLITENLKTDELSEKEFSDANKVFQLGTGGVDFSENTIPLGSLCYINKGATLQAHDIKYRGEFVKDDLISLTQDSTHPKPYIEGKHITDIFRDDVLFLEYGKKTRNPSKVMEPRFPEMFGNPKLVFGKTSGVIIDYENLWCDQSGRVAIPFFYLKNCAANSVVEQKNLGLMKESEKYDLKFLLAIARSPIGKWHFEHASTDTRDKTPDTIKRLPIRQIEFATSASKRKTYLSEIKSKVNSGNKSDLLLFVETHLSVIPEESDIVHDLLAYLAEQMIELNKQKQGEMKRFLNWLEGVLKVSVDEVSGKSKLRNYIGDYQKDETEVSFEEVEEILYKNRGKLGISVSDERVMAKLRGEYEKSLAVLYPLKASLRWTDEVIDQVVYRLYGLTEDEVRVVEGKE